MKKPKLSEIVERISEKFAENPKINKLVSRYGLLVVLALGANDMKSQLVADPTKPQNSIQELITHIATSPEHRAEFTSLETNEIANEDVHYAQTSFRVHKDMDEIVVVADIMDGDMEDTGIPQEDFVYTSVFYSNLIDEQAAVTETWSATQDIFAGYYYNTTGNSYGGAAPAGGEANGLKTIVKDTGSSNRTWIFGHEIAHTMQYMSGDVLFMALDGEHSQAVTDINHTATILNNGNVNEFNNGFTNGGPGIQSGRRRRALSVRPENAAANPANGGDGTHTYKYNSIWDGPVIIDIPYEQLGDGPGVDKVADVMVNYYNRPEIGGFRYEEVDGVEPLTIDVDSDELGIANLADYQNVWYANTTNPAYVDDTSYATKANLFLFAGNDGVNFPHKMAIDSTFTPEDLGYSSTDTLHFIVYNKTSNGESNRVRIANNEVITTSVNELANSAEINVYPNPANDVLNIAYEGEISEVMVSDITGKVVELGGMDFNNKSVDISRLPSGIYIANIFVGDAQEPKRIKFIKQ